MKFPDIPMFQGINAPCRVEADLADLEVIGEIPREIDGAFYRVAADHQFPPLFEKDVPFNGDGMVSMFRFHDGHVSLKARYVRTDRFDDRYQMKSYRHGWLLGFSGTRNQLGHVDLVERSTQSWAAPASSPAMEPCFIPRTPDAPEGDGWIVQAVTDSLSMLTTVNLFDATRIAKGPIAMIRLPIRLKPAFHGTWADASRVKRSPSAGMNS